MSVTTASSNRFNWRVVDITLASVIGVVSAFIYWIVSQLSQAPWKALDALLPGLGASINGLWLLAGPLAAIIIRKPGAALYAEVLGGFVEGLIGNIWGIGPTLLVSIAQGLGAEIVFALVIYKKWSLILTILSGALSGIGSWFYSLFVDLQGASSLYITNYLIASAISGAVFAGVLMWFLYVQIAKTGALDKFASGRQIRGIAD